MGSSTNWCLSPPGARSHPPQQAGGQLCELLLHPAPRGPGPPAGWAPEFLHEPLGFSSQTFLLVKTQTSRVYPGDGAQG